MAESVNEELYDLLVDNAAMGRLYENTVQRDVRRVVSKHKDRLSKIALRNPKSPDVAKEIKRFVKELQGVTTGHITDYGAAQISFHTNSLHKVLGDVYRVVPPAKSALLSDIVGMNIKGDAKLSQQIVNIGDNELKRVRLIVSRGLASALSNQEMVDKIVRTTRITENQANALVRTAITRSTNLAQAEVLQANSGVMKGYQFTAILDDRTSDICKRMDGTLFDIDDKQHLPPLHWRCRSTIIPITKSFNELLESKDDRLRKKVLEKLPADKRRKLDGRSIAKEGYGSWLRRQVYETKLRHLGNDPDKVSLFESGAMELKQFINNKGTFLSMPSLRRLSQKATTVFTHRRAIAGQQDIPVRVQKPLHLLNDRAKTDDLRDFFITEAANNNSVLSTMDYKGTSIAGKRASRKSANNAFDERTSFVNPVTGDVKNSYLYDPDFEVFQERMDFMRASKHLRDDYKDYIEDFVRSLDDKVSVNQQTAILENIRINFERYFDKARPSYHKQWDNFEAITRAEMKNSVVNTSRILDRRSRSRSQQFQMYGKETAEAAIQINGKWTSFDDLSNNLDKDRRFVERWHNSYGKKLARKAYFTGRAPARTYFTDSLKGIKNPKDYLEDMVKKAPGGKRFLKSLKGEPQPSVLEEFLDKKVTGPIKKYLDKDRSIHKLLNDVKNEFFSSNKRQEEAINLLADAFQMAATGVTTDYDTLAINMGKLMYERHPLKLIAGKGDKGFHILGTPSLQNYHKQGSKLLRMMEKQGLIKVAPRGVTRRAVTDIDTGRSDGAWRDTVSREVIIYDKELRRLQEASRRVYVAQRIGIVNDRDVLKLDVNTKTYKTRWGRDTGDRIITRRAFGSYDPAQIDVDIARQIEWANSVKWTVDDDYSDFMLDLVRFRDIRGNAAKYDELNGIRQVVLNRGDMGLGMMQTVKWHLHRKKPFQTLHHIDSRGRIYGRGFLTPTGGEFVRPFLNTARVKPIGEDGFFALQEQIGALLGSGTEGLTNSGRFAVFRKHLDELVDIGNKISSKTQRDRRIREVLENKLLATLDPEEQPKLLRLALEVSRIHKYVDGDWSNLPKIATFKTQLPIEIDASASGAQIIALSTKNRALAEASNVIATPQKNRLYDIMAQDAIADPRIKALGRLPSDLSWEDLSKAAKAQNMVAFYGAGPATQTANLADNFAKDLLKRNFLVVTQRKTGNTPKGAFSLLEINKRLDESIKTATQAGATNTTKDLLALKKEINDIILKDTPVGNTLLKMARDLDPEVEQFVNKLTGTHAGIVGPNEFKTISRVMSEHLARRAPVTEHFIQFWKHAAQEYIIDTNKVDIPWVTFDGKIIRQRYRPSVEEYIDWIDPNTGRRVRNIYRASVDDGKLRGKSSISSARTGLGVNGNHSNDAAIVRQFHLWGRRNDIDTATIHDAFFVNAGDAARAKSALRKLYAEAVESDTVLKTLNQMRKDGLSEAKYRELLNLAKEQGLIPDPADALTSKEILRPLKEGESWYGIGP